MTTDPARALGHHATCPHCFLAVNIEHLLDTARKDVVEEVLTQIIDLKTPVDELTRRLEVLLADANLAISDAKREAHPIHMLRGDA